jgi:hypothetical protein
LNGFISAIHKSNEEQRKFLNTKGSMAFRLDCMMGLYRAASTQVVFGAAELVSSCPQPPTQFDPPVSCTSTTARASEFPMLSSNAGHTRMSIDVRGWLSLVGLQILDT